MEISSLISLMLFVSKANLIQDTRTVQAGPAKHDHETTYKWKIICLLLYLTNMGAHKTYAREYYYDQTSFRTHKCSKKNYVWFVYHQHTCENECFTLSAQSKDKKQRNKAEFRILNNKYESTKGPYQLKCKN